MDNLLVGNPSHPVEAPHDLQTLCAMWRESYKANPIHALRDAGLNLKGFKVQMASALHRFSAEYAFHVAIKNTLRQNGVR